MRGLSSILALLALMTTARASVFLYDGAIQGQLDIYDNPVELQLVPGINVIKGTAIAANNVGHGAEFGFIVPSGFDLDGVTYSYSNLVLSPYDRR